LDETILEKVVMSEFQNCTDWALVNNFTINQKEEEGSKRPLMVTCVPNRLNIELRDFKLGFGVHWIDPDEDEINQKPHHKSEWSIVARGVMKDSVTIFHLQEGVISQFDLLDQVHITGIPNGDVGGKKNANSFVGFGFSGMSSRKVPENGLMEGEPGKIAYIDNRDSDYGDGRTQELCAELYVEQDTFNELIECLKKGYNDIEKINLSICAELFQPELDAALSEPWIKQDYGIRMKTEGGKYVSTNARIEDIQLIWMKRGVKPEPEKTDSDDEFYFEEKDTGSSMVTIEESIKHLHLTVKKNEGALNRIFKGIVCVIGILVFVVLWLKV